MHVYINHVNVAVGKYVLNIYKYVRTCKCMYVGRFMSTGEK